MSWSLLVLLASVLLALQLFAVFMRKHAREELGHVALMLLDLGLLCALLFLNLGSTLAAKVAVSLAAVMVFVPRRLEIMEQRALARDELGLAYRLAQARELLQPGRASTRRRRHLANVIEARSGGAAIVAKRLQREIVAAQDAPTRAMLHDELATIYFLAQRFSDGIRVAENDLPADWAQQHPAFGLYLLRAYCELGRLDGAAATLRLLEAGPAARDFSGLVLLTQARLTLLAFAGRTADLERLLTSAPGLMVSPHARLFLHQTSNTRSTLVLDEALAHFADGVAARAATAAQPLARPRRRALVTPALIIVSVALWLPSAKQAEPALTELIRWGALFRPAVLAGEWWRLVTAMFLHADWLNLGFDAIALYYLGRLCEDVLGPVRTFVVYVASGIAGAAAATLLTRDEGVLIGGSPAIMGLLGALVIVLVRRRGLWPATVQRTLTWSLLFIGGLQILVGWSVPLVFTANLGALVAGALLALVVTPGTLGRGTFERGFNFALAALLAGTLLVAGVQAARTPLDATLAKIPTVTVRLDGVELRVPAYFQRDDDKHELVDPYLGLTVAARAPMKTDDARLQAFVTRIENSKRQP